MFARSSRIGKQSTSRRPAAYDRVAIRLAGAEDAAAIRRVAALDDRRAPTGRVLVAEADGEVIAALSVDSGHAVADPFRWTADVVALMEMRAAQLAESEATTAAASADVVTALRTQLT